MTGKELRALSETVNADFYRQAHNVLHEVEDALLKQCALAARMGERRYIASVLSSEHIPWPDSPSVLRELVPMLKIAFRAKDIYLYADFDPREVTVSW